MTIKNHQITDALGKAIQEHVAAVRIGDKRKGKVLDMLRASGWTASDFVSPKSKGSTATEATWTWLRSQIVAGFTADVQALLAKTGDMTETQKANKRYWQQQIGARISDYKRGVTPKAETGPTGKRSVYVYVDDEITAVIKKVKEAETVEGLDVPAFLKAAAALQKMIRDANTTANAKA